MKILSQKVLASIATAALALGSTTSVLSQTDTEFSTITLNYMTVPIIDIAFVDNLDLLAPPDGTPGPIVDDDTFCVSGMGFTLFSIVFRNPNNPTGGPFELDSSVPGESPIFYEVFFKNDTSPGPGMMVFPDNPVFGNLIQTAMCMDPTMDNAKFDISIPNAEWTGRAAGAPFVGVLEIMVMAE
ncbi:hypothetical protein [Microbulbifer sp. DLAB2-AA]|uniref:hypothetical protein n=1 Tax=Microbulbifer sp. DLAB2-AA TaxID=3243394 RepID=UPI0040392557